MYILERARVKNRFPRFGAPIPLMDGFLHDNVMGRSWSSSEYSTQSTTAQHIMTLESTHIDYGSEIHKDNRHQIQKILVVTFSIHSRLIEVLLAKKNFY